MKKVLMILLVCFALSCVNAGGPVDKPTCELSASWLESCRVYVEFENGTCKDQSPFDVKTVLLDCQGHLNDVYYQCAFDGYNLSVAPDLCSDTPDWYDECGAMKDFLKTNCN